MTASPTATMSYEEIKSQNILTILQKKRFASFLEVGIGRQVKLPQHEFFAANGIAYTGVDFSHVCARHSSALAKAGLLTPRHRFVGNDKGSPNFNLIGLLDSPERFDLVYFDLHHTLNVDAVPAVLATLLARTGSGLIAFDDVQWTLANREGLKKSPFYASIYDFEEYTEEQMRLPHVKVIIESILFRIFELEEDDTVGRRPGWKVYRKLRQIGKA